MSLDFDRTIRSILLQECGKDAKCAARSAGIKASSLQNFWSLLEKSGNRMGLIGARAKN